MSGVFRYKEEPKKIEEEKPKEEPKLFKKSKFQKSGVANRSDTAKLRKDEKTYSTSKHDYKKRG